MKKILIYSIVILIQSVLMFNVSASQSQKNNFNIVLAVLQDNPDYFNGRLYFIEELKHYKEFNIKYYFIDAKGDAEKFKKLLIDKINKEKIDLIFTSGTRTTILAQETVKDIPIIFTAVADPIKANIVNSIENPTANITGTHCNLPAYPQIKTIQKVVPYVKTIGIVYTKGEPNAETQLEEFKKEAKKLGLNIITSSVDINCHSIDEVREATKLIVNKVDILVSLQDTSLSNYGEGMINVAEENQVPTYVALNHMLNQGAVFSLGVDFVSLGKISAAQAIKILKDKKNIIDVPIETDKRFSLVINMTAAKKIGLAIPARALRTASKIIK